MIPARSPEDLGMGRESPRPVQNPEPEAERPAFDLIYRSSIAYVLGMLWRLGVADRDREDVAHEVFLVVQRRLADYDPSLKLRPWLAGITWNVATRWKDLARHRRLELGMSDDEQERAADDPQDPEQLLSTAEVEVQLRALTRTLLQTVPDEQRIVLVMHDLDEIGMPDIARALGISPNTGWDRLRRARLSFEAAVRRLNERDRDALGASGIRPIPLLPIPFDPGAMLEHLRPLPELPAGLQERLWERLQESTAGFPRDGGGDGSVSSAAAPTSAKLAGLAGVKLAAWSALVFVLGGGTGALLHTYAVTSGATEPTTAVLHDSAVVTSIATGASTGAVSSLRGGPSERCVSGLDRGTERADRERRGRHGRGLDEARRCGPPHRQDDRRARPVATPRAEVPAQRTRARARGALHPGARGPPRQARRSQRPRGAVPAGLPRQRVRAVHRLCPGYGEAHSLIALASRTRIVPRPVDSATIRASPPEAPERPSFLATSR